MVPPPVIVEVPAKTPKQPAPPPALPPGQGGPAVTPPPTTAQQVPPYSPKKKKGRRKKADEAQTASGAQPPETTVPPTAAAAQAPQPVAQPVPQLGQVLTDVQRRDIAARVRQAIDSANRNLTSIGTRALSPQQETIRSQVRSFITQADEASKTDLIAARSLAERADLLSKDLLDSLQ
jgi:hypothetical protein